MNEILEMLKNYEIPAEYLEILSSYLFIITLAFVVISSVYAFWGYRIFKVGIAVIGAIAFGVLGYLFVSPYIVNFVVTNFGEDIVNTVNIGAIFGFLFAILGGLLTGLIYKLGIFVMGAGIGYFGGTIAAPYIAAYFPQIPFLSSNIGTIVISAVFALVGAIIFLSMFKLVFILFSSIGGMSLSGLLVGFTVFPQCNQNQMLISLAIGAFIGFIAMIYQFKNSRKEKKKTSKKELRKKMHG